MTGGRLAGDSVPQLDSGVFIAAGRDETTVVGVALGSVGAEVQEAIITQTHTSPTRDSTNTTGQSQRWFDGVPCWWCITGLDFLGLPVSGPVQLAAGEHSFVTSVNREYLIQMMPIQQIGRVISRLGRLRHGGQFMDVPRSLASIYHDSCPGQNFADAPVGLLGSAQQVFCRREFELWDSDE